MITTNKQRRMISTALPGACVTTLGRFAAALAALAALVVAMVSGACALDAAADDAAADDAAAATANASVVRDALLADIEEAARSDTTEAFLGVAAVRAQVPELDRLKRGPFAVVTPLLDSLGPQALLPMLEQLMTSPRKDEAFTATAWTAWRVGLLESVGRKRDMRAAPVLTEVLLASESNPHVSRAAASGLAKLGDDTSIDLLMSLATGASNRQRDAVLGGLGDARQARVANFLATQLDKHPHDATTRVLVRALGSLGNSWAWQTAEVQARGDGDETRHVAAQALLRHYVAVARERDEVWRRGTIKALLLVDDPSTLEMVAALRANAAPDLSAALDVLRDRMARNPLHRYE